MNQQEQDSKTTKVEVFSEEYKKIMDLLLEHYNNLLEDCKSLFEDRKKLLKDNEDYKNLRNIIEEYNRNLLEMYNKHILFTMTEEYRFGN